ncbi:HEAT repeat domain-containing protein [Vitiosangium sp. GDMCC 1.1324]|uniref:HEAT repeat domain-containing protein n=1 Tax=Vitiosangium sp. (strain GDMCC 1.1324) TaxID=2138576 RepID=UPI001E299456|nr:HEAT repeat domain-containing protein [Vitiosangium sp. GDMCC 1.1324]
MLYRYEVSTDQKVAFANKTPSGVDSALPGMHLSIQGEWNVGVVAIDGERIDVRVNLKLSTFQLSAEDKDVLTPEVRRTLTTALEMPFFLTLGRSGSVALTHFEEGVDDLSRGVLRTLVASSQFVVYGAPTASWQAEEHDTTGKYVAVYQRLAPNRFEKTKQSYTHVATPQGLQPLGSDIRISVNTRAAFELGEDLWAQSLQSNEHLEVDTSAGLPAALTDLELSLRLLERRRVPSLIGSLEARQGLLSTSPLASFQGRSQDPLAHYRQVLGNKTFEDLVKELRSLPAEEKARDDARTRALEQLRALFMLKPEEALKVPDILRSGLSPLAASPMLGALSAASTPQAIQSLVTASGDQALSTDVRMDAVSALGMAGEPTREGVDALRNLGRDPNPMLRDTATLAFGNAAFQMSDTDARGAEALVYELSNGYRTASTPEQQAIVLRSMGNTRAPGTLDTLRTALRSSSVLVREAAMVALRNVPGPEADQLLSSQLLADPAVQVRRSAVFACSFRPPGPLLPALGQALRKDPSDAVRSDIIQLLGNIRGSVPEALVLLGWASQNEPHPELRQMATVFLNTPTTPVPSQPDSTPTR